MYAVLETGGKQYKVEEGDILYIEKIEVKAFLKKGGVQIEAMAKCTGKTGIEMEALTAVSVALLTVYDMCKAVDKNMKIGDIVLIEKNKVAI